MAAIATASGQVEKVICDMEHCSDDVKTMLIRGLPHAFGSDRHEYQAKFAGMLKTTLEQGKKWSEDMQQKNDQESQETKTALEVAQGNFSAMKDAENVAQTAKDGKVAAHKRAISATEAEFQLHNESLAKKIKVADDRKERENAKAEVASVLDGSLRMLMDGGWGDDELRDASIEGVCTHLKTLGSDPALLAALPKALSNKPADRGVFDNMAVDESHKVLSTKVQAVTEKLAEGAAQFEEVNAEFLGAWAIWEEAKDREVAASSEVSTSESALKIATRETKMAQTKVNELEQQIGVLTAQRTLLDAKVEEIDSAFQAFETLEKGEEVVQSEAQATPTVSCAAAVAEVVGNEGVSVAMVC